MIQSIQLVITGRVQGVFYRASMRDKAEALGASGFVQNREDGSVYAEIEGEEQVLGKLIDWCHAGPAGARVDGVKATHQPAKGYQGFAIRRS